MAGTTPAEAVAFCCASDHLPGMQNLSALPRTWDLTSYFPSFDGAEYRQGKSDFTLQSVAQGQQASDLGALTADTRAAWAAQFTIY